MVAFLPPTLHPTLLCILVQLQWNKKPSSRYHISLKEPPVSGNKDGQGQGGTFTDHQFPICKAVWLRSGRVTVSLYNTYLSGIHCVDTGILYNSLLGLHQAHWTCTYSIMKKISLIYKMAITWAPNIQEWVIIFWFQEKVSGKLSNGAGGQGESPHCVRLLKHLIHFLHLNFLFNGDAWIFTL